MKSPKYDIKIAKEMVDSFVDSCNVPCSLYSADGSLLYFAGDANEICPLCHRVSAVTGKNFHCDNIHRQSHVEAYRFGGKYMYFCPFNAVCFSAAIMTDGQASGALVGGPVLMSDDDGFIEDLIKPELHLDASVVRSLKYALNRIPKLSPTMLNRLAAQLFADAVYISDSYHEMFRANQDQMQSNRIGDYIRQFKSSNMRESYPVDLEQEFLSSIDHGNIDGAIEMLERLVAHLFTYDPKPENLKKRFGELIVLAGRAAVYGGANPERNLELTQKYLRQLVNINNIDELSGWLNSAVRQLSRDSHDFASSSHSNIMMQAVDYINCNSNQPLTVELVAENLGYSASHFSRLFKAYTGKSFHRYLNELRVENSKAMLLTTKLPLSVIGTQVGFSDQSYFSRVFKKVTGSTPDCYRRQQRRVDEKLERGQK